MAVAQRSTPAIYDEALAPAGIGLAQFSLLRKIERGGKLSLSELGRLASLDRSTVGRNIKVLRRMGLIEIGPGDDHREATVTLAEEGRAVLRNGAPLWDAAQRRIETALGDGGAEALRALLAQNQLRLSAMVDMEARQDLAPAAARLAPYHTVP